MAFIDQCEFDAMKTLSSRRAPCCDKHCAKMIVNHLLDIVVEHSSRNKKEE